MPEYAGPILLNLLSSACTLHYLADYERMKQEAEEKGGRVSLFSLLRTNGEEAAGARYGH